MNEKKFELASVETTAFDVVAEGTGATVRESTSTDDVILFNAVNGTGEKIADLLGQDIVLTDIVVTSADVHEDPNDDESPIINKACVNMFTADGRQISSISNGIIRATKALFACGFEPSPEMPITVRFKEITTKKGKAHTFDLIKRGA